MAESDLDAILTKIGNLRAIIARRDQAIEKLETNVGTYIDTISDLQDRQSDYVSTINKLQDERDYHIKTIEQLQNQQTNYDETLIESMTMRISQLEAQGADTDMLLDHVSDLESQLHQTRADLKMYMARNNTLIKNQIPSDCIEQFLNGDNEPCLHDGICAAVRRIIGDNATVEKRLNESEIRQNAYRLRIDMLKKDHDNATVETNRRILAHKIGYMMQAEFALRQIKKENAELKMVNTTLQAQISRASDAQSTKIAKLRQIVSSSGINTTP